MFKHPRGRTLGPAGAIATSSSGSTDSRRHGPGGLGGERRSLLNPAHRYSCGMRQGILRLRRTEGFSIERGITCRFECASAVPASRLRRPAAGAQQQQLVANDVPQVRRKLGTISVADGDDPSCLDPMVSSRRPPSAQSADPAFGLFQSRRSRHRPACRRAERNIGGGLGLQRGSNVGMARSRRRIMFWSPKFRAPTQRSGSAVDRRRGRADRRRLGGCWRHRSRKTRPTPSLRSPTSAPPRRSRRRTAMPSRTAMSFGRAAAGFFGGGSRARRRRLSTIPTSARSSRFLYPGLFEAGDRPEPGQPGATGQSGAVSPNKTFTATGPVACTNGRRHRQADSHAAARRDGLSHGKQNGLWWEVADENDNVGWVLNTKLEPSR